MISIHLTLSTAAIAALVEQHETLTQDAIPAARDDNDHAHVAWLELRAKAVAARLELLGASDLLYLRWLEREAPQAIEDGLRALHRIRYPRVRQARTMVHAIARVVCS